MKPAEIEKKIQETLDEDRKNAWELSAEYDLAANAGKDAKGAATG